MRILAVTPLPGYRLDLSFDNGENGVIDLSSLVGHGVFQTWKQDGVFEQIMTADQGALEWPSEIDLCPDALYLQMTGKKPDDLFPLLRKGRQRIVDDVEEGIREYADGRCSEAGVDGIMREIES